MFCHKCGNQVADGAAFCHKCGTKVIQNKTATQATVESVNVTTPQSVKTPKSPTAKVSTAAQESSASISTTPTLEGAAEICDLLSEGLSHCSKIKSVSLTSKGNAIIMKGKVYNYIANVVNGQIRLNRAITIPFTIPFAIIVGFLAWVIASIGWDMIDYGFNESYALPLAIGLIALGSFFAILSFLGERETATVLPYIRQTIEPRELLVPPDEKQKRSYIITLTAMLVIAVIGIVMLIFIVIDNFEFGSSKNVPVAEFDNSSSSIVENISLSQTYASETEGFTFNYPDTWGFYDGGESTILAISDTGGSTYNARMTVSRYEPDDIMTVSKEEYHEHFSKLFDGYSILEFLDNTSINGISMRKVTASYSDTSDVIVGTQYIYIVNNHMYVINFSSLQINYSTYEPIFNAIMDSYTITAANSSGESGKENSSEGSQSMQWKVAYTNKVRELAAQNDELQFALIDLTESDIPALVADYSGYYVSVFIWADETLVTVMEDWAYGAMGNHGYEYLPGGNVIRNQNSDQAGAIVYEFYMTMNDAHEVVDLYDETLSFWFFKDTNGNGTIDENEPFSEEPYYYYGNTEITREEYETYRIPGEYERITGDKSTEEILSHLNGESGTVNSYPSISYKGIPISNLLGSTDGVIALLGDSPLNDEFKLRYDDMEFYHENGNITSLVSFDPSLFEADGIPLNQNRDGLIKIFGQNREEGGEDGAYYIKYNLPECSLFFELGEHDSEAWRISISPGATMNSALGEISYKGIPVIPLLETSIDDIIALLGKPTAEGQYLQGYFYDYNNEILFILDADKRDISWIEISPEALTAGGVSLDKDRAFLIKTFGGPTEEYIDEMTREYTISYNMKKYAIAFILPDSSSKVSKVRVYFSGL